MTARILLFTQPGCLSCELMKCFLDAKGIAFEETDISSDVEARREMTEQYGSRETPTLVVFPDPAPEARKSAAQVIMGFDPESLDQLLDPAPSSDSVTES